MRKTIMRRRISLAELADAGVRIRYDEAIAIAQQLVHGSGGHHPPFDERPPFGPPSPGTVFVDVDGNVTCPSCEATVAVSELGMFLHAVLAFDNGRVPGAVRYTVARSLLEVDAPPFDSLEEFSDALARYERGDRGEVIRGLIDRARGADVLPTEGVPSEERRRTPAGVAELRRQLRDADARVYEQQRALDELGVMATTVAARRTRRLAIAAGLAAGLALIGVGEAMKSHSPVPLLVMPASPSPGEPGLQALAPPDDNDIVLGDEKPLVPSATPVASATSTGRRPSIERVEHPRPAQSIRAPRAPRRGWMRLSWLRTKIAIRHDSL
jgi:hypothetical protein